MPCNILALEIRSLRSSQEAVQTTLVTSNIGVAEAWTKARLVQVEGSSMSGSTTPIHTPSFSLSLFTCRGDSGRER